MAACQLFLSCDDQQRVDRRLFFIGVLPLLGDGAVRAFIGVFASTAVAFFAREVWPFVRPCTNILLFTANLQILAVFFAAALLLTDSLDGFGLSNFEVSSAC